MNNREAFEALEQNKGKFLPRTETGYRDTFVDRDYKMFCLGLKAFAEANICSRSHPHDDMSETCKWLSVEAKNACLASHQVELSSNTLQLQSQAQQPTEESVNKLRYLADQCKVAASCLTYNGARAEAVAKHLLLEASQGLRRSQAQQPSDISKQLREYAADSGYSHNDYADTMLAAASEIERCAARLGASHAQHPAQEPVKQERSTLDCIKVTTGNHDKFHELLEAILNAGERVAMPVSFLSIINDAGMKFIKAQP